MFWIDNIVSAALRAGARELKPDQSLSGASEDTVTAWHHVAIDRSNQVPLLNRRQLEEALLRAGSKLALASRADFYLLES